MRYKSRHAKRFRGLASLCSGNELVGEQETRDVKRGDNRFYREPYRQCASHPKVFIRQNLG
jgi:hypothetical protein